MTLGKVHLKEKCAIFQLIIITAVQKSLLILDKIQNLFYKLYSVERNVQHLDMQYIIHL